MPLFISEKSESEKCVKYAAIYKKFQSNLKQKSFRVGHLAFVPGG